MAAQDRTPARNDWLDAARRLRRHAGAVVVDNFFKGLSSVGRLHPRSRPERNGVEKLSDLPYRATGDTAHLLDVYRPVEASGSLPIVVYIHGGGFRILSKDSHWIMGLAFARAGYLVFNINYRLAPRHPYPAAVEDACAALEWVVRHAADYGGDLDRLVLAGESAGANLVTALSVATSYRRPEPWARAVWGMETRPRVAIAACGMLQVTDPSRFVRRRPTLSSVIYDRIQEVSEAYVGLGAPQSADFELADPLRVLERGDAPDRPLPAFFAPVGTRDPLLDDTRRLKTALDRMGVPCDVRYYEGEPHAFHAAIWRANARHCWEETYAFLDRHLAKR